MESAPSSEHLAALVRSAHTAIISVGRDGRILSWNPGAERLLGFSADEAIARDWTVMLQEERREEIRTCIARVEAGDSVVVESLCRHKDGHRVEVSISLAPVRDAHGQVVATGAVVHDRTGRKAAERQYRQEIGIRRRTEEALESRSRDLQAFFEMANVGNVIAESRTGRFLRVNRFYCELTGYSEAELLAMTSYDLTHPEDVERDRMGWEESVRQGAPNFTIEKRYRTKDGRTIWVHVTSTVLRDVRGEPLHAIGVVRDVSDRRLAMEELEKARAELEARVAARTSELAAATTAARQSAERFETLIDNSPLAIISVDRQALVNLWNPAAERLFGWPAVEVLGRPLPNLPTENRQAYEAEVRSMATSPERRHWETIRRKRDGSLVEIAIWRAPLFDTRHEVCASIAILMDITERRFLERALLEAAERESRRIGQELHDHLCQHLLGAAFSAKAVAMGLAAETPASTALHDLAQLINSAVQQTREIARGLNPVELDAAGLRTALQELVNRVRPGIRCRLHCEEHFLMPDASTALHAYRVAQEAVANAVAHSGATEMVIRLTEDNQNVILQIEDNGRGFEAEAENRLGLGIAIMKYRAHAISGKLRIDTSRDGGTSVMLVLPKR